MSLLDKLNGFSMNSDGTSDVLQPGDYLLKKIEEAGYDMSELRTVITTPGNKLALSCAGAGKTTALGFIICYDIVTGQLNKQVTTPNGDVHNVSAPILVTTFLKSGAEDLRRSVNKLHRDFKLPGNTSNIKYSTLHAEFKSVMDALNMSEDILTDEKRNNKMLAKVAKRMSLYLNAETLKALAGALSYTRNTISDRRYNANIYNDLNLSAGTIDLLIDMWADERKAKGVMDFDDIQVRLYNMLYGSDTSESIKTKLRTYLERKYVAIYFDEAQDLSEIQYAIAKAYTGGKHFKKVVACGDDDQTIYTWRGSAQDIITKKIVQDFDATVVTLTKNRRTPSNIVNAVAPSIANNSERYPKSLTASREGGVLRYGTFSNLDAMALALKETVEACITHQRSVAIICRTNMAGLLPAFMLERMDTNIQFKITSDSMTLDSYIGKQIMSIFTLIEGKGTAEMGIALNQLLPYRVRSEAGLVKEACNSRSEPLWALDEDEFQYSAPNLWEGHVKGLKQVRKDLNDNYKFMLYLLNYYKEYVYTKDKDYDANARNVINTLMVLATRPEYKDNYRDFVYDIKELNSQLKARKSLDPKSVKVQIATVHELKGKEMNDAIIWNASDENFPHNLSEDLEEERRIWYIACTRPNKTLTILAPSSNPSPFINEMDMGTATKIKPKYTLSKK